MIIQNKAEHKGDNLILNMDSWSHIQTVSVGEYLIALEVLDMENEKFLIGIYPERVEGLVMKHISDQIQKQILAGVEKDDLFIIAPEESELVEPEC